MDEEKKDTEAEEGQRTKEKQKSIVDQLAMPEAADIEFELPKLSGKLFKPADFSCFIL